MKRNNFLRTLLTRCSLIYLVYSTFSQCPSYTDNNGVLAPDSPYICSGINEIKADVRWVFSHPLYKHHVGQHIDPYFDQAQVHYKRYGAPVVSKTKHYGFKYGIPAAQQAQGLYQQHVQPIYLKAHDHAKKQYDIHAKPRVDRYYNEAEQRYRKHLAPHVDYAKLKATKLHSDTLKFHQEKVAPFNAKASQHIQDTYRTTKPIVQKAVTQSVDFYKKKFEPAAYAAVDTLWHLIKEIAYKIKIVSTDLADKGYVWSKDVYENHAKPYYQKNVAPTVSQKYKQYLEPTVNDAKKFIFAHVDMVLVEQSWNMAKMHTEQAYRFVEKHALVAAAITADFLKEQRAKYEEQRIKAAETAKSVQHEAILSASSAAAKLSKIVVEQESSVKGAGAQATHVAGDIKDKAKGAVHHFASEAVNMAKNAQTKVYDAAGTVMSQASKGSDAAFSQFEKAKQAVAGSIHHVTDEASSVASEASSKMSSINTDKTQEPSITPVAAPVTTFTSQASPTAAGTYSYPTGTKSSTADQDDKAHITPEKNTVQQHDTNDSAQTIAAPFLDATKPNHENASAKRATASPVNNESTAEIFEENIEDVGDIIIEQVEELPADEPTTDSEETIAQVLIDTAEDLSHVQGRVPVTLEKNDTKEDEEQDDKAEVTESVKHQFKDEEQQPAPTGPVVPELNPKRDDDLSEVPPNDVAQPLDEAEFKQAPIRPEQKGYLNNVVSDEIEEIIKSADIIRTQLEMKYDDIEREALESVQRVADSIEEDSQSLVSSIVQTFKDFYQLKTADSTTSNEDKLKAVEDKYRDTLDFLYSVVSKQRDVSSETARQAKADITSAQKAAEGQIRQRFKEGLHHLRSSEQDVTGLNERQRRELKTKLEDAQVQALKLVHSAEAVIAVEQRLLDARTHRISSKIDRLVQAAKEQLGQWLVQAHQVLTIKEPLIDLEATTVEADLEGFEIEHVPIPEETSRAESSENVTPVEPVAEHVRKELQHQQIIDDHIRKAQERAARVAKTVEDWVEAAKRKSARTEVPSL